MKPALYDVNAQAKIVGEAKTGKLEDVLKKYKISQGTFYRYKRGADGKAGNTSVRTGGRRPAAFNTKVNTTKIINRIGKLPSAETLVEMLAESTVENMLLRANQRG